VAEFVKDDRYQIDLIRALVGIKSVVPGVSHETRRLAEVHIETRDDVRRRRDTKKRVWVQFEPRTLVGQGRMVPGAREHFSGKIPEDENGAGGAEHRCSRCTREGLEHRNDADLDGTVQTRGPQIGCSLERDEPLLTDGRSGVAANWCSWCRVVETDARPVGVDNRDSGVREYGGRC